VANGGAGYNGTGVSADGRKWSYWLQSQDGVLLAMAVMEVLAVTVLATMAELATIVKLATTVVIELLATIAMLATMAAFAVLAMMADMLATMVANGGIGFDGRNGYDGGVRGVGCDGGNGGIHSDSDIKEPPFEMKKEYRNIL